MNRVFARKLREPRTALEFPDPKKRIRLNGAAVREEELDEAENISGMDIETETVQ
jgi:hypothetical protein